MFVPYILGDFVEITRDQRLKSPYKPLGNLLGQTSYVLGSSASTYVDVCVNLRRHASTYVDLRRHIRRRRSTYTSTYIATYVDVNVDAPVSLRKN